MEWFRWYHGAVSDHKWPVIARKSGHNVGTVIAIWAALLEHASQDEDRGSIATFDGETFDVLYGFEDGTCDAVIAAMKQKNIIVDDCIAAWNKRQVKREDPDAADRQREKRARDKAKKELESRAITSCHADVTHCHTKSRPEQNREEQRREDINTLSASAPPSASPDAARADSPPHALGEENTPDVPEESYRTKKGRKLKGQALAGFNRFWLAFAHPKGKAEAADAWLDIPGRTPELVDKIILAAEGEAAARPQLVAAGRTPKWAQGWLTARRWEDEPVTANREKTLEELMAERGIGNDRARTTHPWA